MAETTSPAPPLDALRSPAGGRPWDGEPIRRLRALLATEREDLWVVIVYSVAIGLLTLATPIAVQAVVNTIAFGTLYQPLAVLALFLLVALGFSALMTGLRFVVVEIIQRRVFVRVAADSTFRLLNVRAEAFDRIHPPELVNRFFDVVTVQKSGSVLLIDGLALLMQTAVGMIVLAIYHPILLVFDLILLMAMVLIVFVMGRGAVKTAIYESKAKYALAAWLEELAEGYEIFKSKDAARYALDRSDDLTYAYLKYRKSHFRIVLRQVAGALALQAIASAALLGVGGLLVMEGQLTLGQLVAAELIVTAAVGGFSKFGKKLETYYDLMAAIDKLGNLIDLPMEISGRAPLPVSDQPAAIEFRGVGFAYSDGAAVLENANLLIRPGERLGLTGPSGSGKSAVVDLLAGLRRQRKGVLLYDGVDTRELDIEDWRSRTALVRGIQAFTGTIEENLTMGRPAVSAEFVREALRSVDLNDDILDLPDGVQTRLTPSGRPLAPGQAARLMLARAIAGRPRLLILDDALDDVNEPELRLRMVDMLFDRDAPWTLVCVTRSPDLLALCDRVIEPRDERLIEVPGGRLWPEEGR